MKFSDILKTIGLINKLPRNASAIVSETTTPVLEIDRIFRPYQQYQQYQNPYANPVGAGSNPAAGNAYYPPVYNAHAPRDYRIKLGVPHSGGGHGHTAPAGVGHSGYGHSGHGGPVSHHSAQPPHYHHGAIGGGGSVGVGSGGGGAGGSGYDYEHSVSSRHKSKASSAVTALTLLSFFFFINLLQNCLQEHMDAMNPTVMVMTTGVSRSSDNKFKELYRSGSKKISSVEEDVQEENHHGRRGPMERNEKRREGYDKDEDFKGDYDHERFTYPNGTVALTKSQNQDHHFHNVYQKDELKHHGDEIRTKLRNDYFKDGTAHFTRIY